VTGEGTAGDGTPEPEGACVDVATADGTAVTAPAGLGDGEPPTPAHPAETTATASVVASLQPMRLIVRWSQPREARRKG